MVMIEVTRWRRRLVCIDSTGDARMSEVMGRWLGTGDGFGGRRGFEARCGY